MRGSVPPSVPAHEVRNGALFRPALIALANVDLRLIRVFVAVVDNHGFSAAQAELGMVTSTISSHMAMLEDRLGNRLCQRGRGGFILTPEGQVVYEAAQALLREVETFQTHVDSLRGSLAGMLRIGAIDTAVSNPSSPLLGAIRKYNKRANVTRLSLFLDDLATIERMVLNGQLDLAVLSALRKIEGIHYTYLYDEWQMLYCARTHPLFHYADESISNDLLSQQRVVSRDLWATIETEKFFSKRPDAIINHIDTKAHLILTGSYIGFMPTVFAAQWVDSGMLRSIRPNDFAWTTAYYLITKKGAGPSRQLRVFLRDVAGVIQTGGPPKAGPASAPSKRART
ncbi:MAG: LysR family transcriptional regulator [Parvibaculaceae bacterium]